MAQIDINIRMDEDLIKQAEYLFSEFGMNMTTAFTVFAKTFGDLGLVYNKPIYKTTLNNKLLYSGGFGIDIFSIYDVNLRIEYSFNQLGKNGLFLQAQSGL